MWFMGAMMVTMDCWSRKCKRFITLITGNLTACFTFLRKQAFSIELLGYKWYYDRTGTEEVSPVHVFGIQCMKGGK